LRPVKRIHGGIGNNHAFSWPQRGHSRPDRRGAFQEQRMNRKILLVGLAVVVGMAVAVGALIYVSGKSQPSTQAVERTRGSLVQFYSPTIGNPEAKVHIVEFIDPACETCATFYPYVKQIMAANPDKVRLTLRLVPFHKGSDYVVKLLEAARKQGKFWPALEALLANQSQWVRNHTVLPEFAWKPLEGLGLNLDQMKVDMASPEIAQRIEQELNDAKALKVTQTPEYFVNGRPLPSFGLEQLQALVRDELRAAYR
jgi:protein-disulfide isomerase